MNPGLSETGSMFKGRVWDAVPEDIGFVFLNTRIIHIAKFYACVYPLTL